MANKYFTTIFIIIIYKILNLTQLFCSIVPKQLSIISNHCSIHIYKNYADPENFNFEDIFKTRPISIQEIRSIPNSSIQLNQKNKYLDSCSFATFLILFAQELKSTVLEQLESSSFNKFNPTFTLFLLFSSENKENLEFDRYLSNLKFIFVTSKWILLQNSTPFFYACIVKIQG
jgi:hypothetical protein